MGQHFQQVTACPVRGYARSTDRKLKMDQARVALSGAVAGGKDA